MSGPHETQPTGEPRDEQTLALLAVGDTEGLRRLLQDYGGLVKSRLRKDFGKQLDDGDLEETMGQMAINVWQAARRFDPAKGTLRAWMTVIARNCALQLIAGRNRRPDRSDPGLDQFTAPPRGPLAPSTARQVLIADLHRCLAALPPLQRAVLMADLEAGHSAPAAALAERHGTTPNSIYVSRQKGRTSLRKLMAALGHDSARLPRAANPPTPAEPHLEPRTEHG